MKTLTSTDSNLRLFVSLNLIKNHLNSKELPTDFEFLIDVLEDQITNFQLKKIFPFLVKHLDSLELK